MLVSPPPLQPLFLTLAPVHTCIRVEFVPLRFCPGLAHSPSQNRYCKAPSRHSPTHGPPDGGTVPILHHCLGSRFLRLCGLPLVNLAFCVWKSFFPRPHLSHRGCSFQGPWTTTATELQRAAWSISGKVHGVSEAHLGLSSGKCLIPGHPSFQFSPKEHRGRMGLKDFIPRLSCL